MGAVVESGVIVTGVGDGMAAAGHLEAWEGRLGADRLAVEDLLVGLGLLAAVEVEAGLGTVMRTTLMTLAVVVLAGSRVVREDQCPFRSSEKV